MNAAVNASRLDTKTPFDGILATAMTLRPDKRMLYAHTAIVKMISTTIGEENKQSLKDCFRVFNVMFGPPLPKPDDMDFI
jgi:hypothetical protein